MAGWRCVICFAFTALTLKVFLSHINSARGRSKNFRVTCGIDGCKEEYRVYNSFYYHIKRRHTAYLANGRPPREGMPFDPSCHGGERFDIPIFSNCITPTTHQVQDSTRSHILWPNTTRDGDCHEGTIGQDERAEMFNQGHIQPQLPNKEKVDLNIECCLRYLLSCRSVVLIATVMLKELTSAIRPIF